jgi:hypothetical protein
MDSSALKQTLIRLVAVTVLLLQVTACAPAKDQTEVPAPTSVPSQTPAPAATTTPAPPTETLLQVNTPASETAGQPTPELAFAADRWGLTAASFRPEVTLSSGPQPQTLTAGAGEGFVVLELESLTGKDLFGVFVQYGGELSTVYLTDGDGRHFPALQFTAVGIPAERFTIIFEALPMVAGSQVDFHFLDAEPVRMAELLAAVPIAQAPAGEPYYLYPFCNCEDEVPPDMAPVLRWAWGTTTQEYLDDFFAAGNTSTLFIDGETYTSLEAYWDEGSYYAEEGLFKAYWTYPLPALPAGVHRVELTLALDRAVTDGFDGNADGEPDQYGPGETFSGWVDVRIAAPYGPPSAECPNGAPAGHWALIVNKASAGQGSITIDGKKTTVESGRNVFYLTADVSHPIQLGGSTIGYSAPECGENSLDVP